MSYSQGIKSKVKSKPSVFLGPHSPLRAIKRSQCGRSASWYRGRDSGREYVKILYCHDRLCPKCGNKNGANHKRRKRSIIDWVKRDYGSLDGLGIRQVVFTLPADLRSAMKSKAALNAFFVLVEGLLKGLFPGRQIVLSVHLFGDKDLDFKPHVNGYVVERVNVPGGVLMKLAPDRLALVKSLYVQGLQKLGYDVASADVHYKFTLDKPRFLHGVNYLSRPCPDEKTLVKISECDSALFDFLMSKEMKGFLFIRKTRVKVGPGQFLEGGVKKRLLEKLRFVEKKRFVWRSFVEQYREWERVEIYPGFFALRPGGLTDADRADFSGWDDG